MKNFLHRKLNLLVCLSLTVLTCHVNAGEGEVNDTLKDWRKSVKKRGSDWYRAQESDSRFLVKCYIVYCSVVDFEFGQVNIVASASSELQSKQLAQKIMKETLIDINEWKNILIPEAPPETMEELTNYISTKHLYSQAVDENFVTTMTLYMTIDHKEKREAFHKKYIEHYAKEYKIDPSIINALIAATSKHNRFAVYHTGHMGLLFINPNESGIHAVELTSGIARKPTKLELTRPATNIKLGIAYLSYLYDFYSYVKSDDVRVLLSVISYLWNPTDANSFLKPEPDLTLRKLEYNSALIPSYLEAIVNDFIKKRSFYN